MELLNSIKKQRELFSHTLSTANLPNELAMDNDSSDRQPLSPRNKKAGVSDTRQLVSSLRSNREDLLKRYERASQSSQATRPENEENARFNNKAVVDMTLLETNVHNMTLSSAARDTNDLSTRVKSFQDKIRSMEELEERPRPRSIAQSLEKFENRPENNDETTARPYFAKEVSKKQVCEPWRGAAEERESTTSRPSNFRCNDSSLQKEYSTRIIASSQTPKGTAMISSGDENRRKSFPSTTRKGSTDSSWIRNKPSSEEVSCELETKPGAEIAMAVGSASAPREEQIMATSGKAEERSSTEKGVGKQISYKNNLDSSMKRKHILSTKDSSDEAQKLKPATPSASWIKPTSERCGDTSNENQTSGGHRQYQKKSAPTPTSWTKKTPLTLDTSDPTNGSTTRHSLGSALCLGEAGPPSRGRQEARRKSVGDLSWIKRNEDPELKEKPINDSRPKAPWVRSTGEELPFLKSPTAKRTHHDASSRGNYKLGSTVGASTSDEDFVSSASSGENIDECKQEPHNLALSDKVSLFESTRKSSTPSSLQKEPKNDVQTAREKWQAVDKSLAAESPVLPVKVITKPVAMADKASKRPNLPIVTSPRRISVPTKNTKISSLINKMEKFSQGGEFECDHSVQLEDEPTSPNDETNFEEGDVEIVRLGNSYDPAENTECCEYGDANFSFGVEDEVEESLDHQTYLFEESDEASEGSTYKIDNYQKEFNETIPIEGPWMHPTTDAEKPLPDTGFDAFGDFTCSERNTMTILSIAPCRSLAAPSYEVDDYVEPMSQENLYREKRPLKDRSLATRRTYHQVARNCLLSASKTPKGHKRSKSVGGFVSFAEADPIFSANDDVEHKSSMRTLKNFILSKPRDEEACNSQEENKPSKSVFKILKKGLGSSSSSKRDDAYEHHTLEDTHEETTVVDNEYLGFQTDASRTTISSITRSVTSGDSNKPVTMPLGVLNGFFKAARKLQKKSKKKPGRGRSVSNFHQAPSTGIRPEFVLPPPTPPTEVQLWPNPQGPVPTQETTGNSNVVIGDRRFGAYGGLAASRSALKTSVPQIQSLASW